MRYSIKKRPQVIHDLIEIATYIGENNLNMSDQFLIAAESTINQLAQYPLIGKQCNFKNPSLNNIRQYPIKKFKNYLIFYIVSNLEIDIIRVIQGSRNIENILADTSED